VLQTTDQPSWIIVNALKASTPGKTVMTACRGVPFTAELHQSQERQVEFSGQGHERWNNPSEATVRSRLRQQQNRYPPGSESFHPAAFSTFVNAHITAQAKQRQFGGITAASSKFAQQWMGR